MTGDPPAGFSIGPAGDAALLISLAPIIDPVVNARAISIAQYIEAIGIPGVRDVVPTYRSVAVYVDPHRVDIEALIERLSAVGADVAPPVTTARTVEIPVVYGGEAGPDLPAIAEWANLTADEVIARHSATTYRVFMLGFLPGFPYMGTVDPRIAAPRRATPRLRVPAGSVGIAGAQTGIYPTASPGGWQIIGRTARPLFDSRRNPPSTLVPGDRVRFVVASDGADQEIDPRRDVPVPARPAGLPVVTVIEPGLFTTIQDAGRWGHQRTGVAVSGVMDWLSFRAANLLVGNPDTAAVLEATITGPALRFEGATAVAIAGADLGAMLDGRELQPGKCVEAIAGSELRFGRRRKGARAYIAFGGGLHVDPVLGSVATHTVSGMGGLDGRALRAGDRLPLAEGRQTKVGRSNVAMDWVRTGAAPVRVRVLPGPQADRFPAASIAQLTAETFTITPQSNRMGYRLAGGSVLPPAGEMISDATFTGAIQVPPSGEPILLMADRQTTGGYAQLATVITADLPLAAQLAPNDSIRFSICTQADARAALAERELMLARLV